MRQLWTRAFHLRVFLVVAALSVITLAASGPIYSAVTGSHVIGHTFASPVAAGGTSATGDCSKGTASKAVTRYRIGVNRFQKKAPVYQVLCGAFLGPGSRGMVGSVAIPSCGGSVDWAVFRWAGGTWRLVMNVKHGAFLDAVGSDIREKIGVLGPGDSHCFPSSVKYRFWRWNGRALNAGTWARALSFDSVISSDGNMWCGFTVYPTPEARCASLAPVHTARLRRNGAVTTCDTSSDCLKGFERKNAHVLPYGQADEWNEFHCLSETKGITCTVIGGKAAGRGFLINSGGVTQVGP